MNVFVAEFELVPHIWATTSLYYLKWRSWTQSWTKKKKGKRDANLPQANERKQLSRGSGLFRIGG